MSDTAYYVIASFGALVAIGNTFFIKPIRDRLPIPFPYFDMGVGGWGIALGWKSRGSFGGKLRRA